MPKPFDGQHNTVLSQSDLYRAFDGPPDAIVRFLEWLIGAEHLPGTPNVLDLGAGPGRLIAPLAVLGWSITAYEPDWDYFPTTAATARTFSNVIAKQAGFEDVSEVDTFDLACGINSSYAHLLSSAQRATALRQVARSLRQTGLLLLDLPNFPWILAHYRQPVPLERVWKGKRITRYREHRIDREQVTVTTIDRDVVTDAGRKPVAFIKRHVYAIVDHETHLSELAAAGFTDVTLFSHFDARLPVTVPTGRLIYVARRRSAV